MRLHIVAIISLLALASCTHSAENTEVGEVSIAHLKSLCKGEHHRIVEDVSVRGVVVAKYWLGELHNSIIIVDASEALEIAVEVSDIAHRLPIYTEVVVSCNGLMLARIGGKIELGIASSGEFPLSNMSEEIFAKHINKIGVREDYAPTTKRFTEIGVGDIGNIFRFENVQFVEAEEGASWCDFEEEEAVTTYRTLVDTKGNTLPVQTLSTCEYAREKLPTKRVSVIGVIDYSDNRYFLRVINKWFI